MLVGNRLMKYAIAINNTVKMFYEDKENAWLDIANFEKIPTMEHIKERALASRNFFDPKYPKHPWWEDHDLNEIVFINQSIGNLDNKINTEDLDNYSIEDLIEDGVLVTYE